MANEALLIIDYTNDFVADDGALTCGQAAQTLDEHITQLADDFLKAGKWVYLPTDVHQQNDPYHPESLLYPPQHQGNLGTRAVRPAWQMVSETPR